MSDTTLFFIGVVTICFVLAAIFLFVTQINRMASLDHSERLRQEDFAAHFGAPILAT